MSTGPPITRHTHPQIRDYMSFNHCSILAVLWTYEAHIHFNDFILEGSFSQLCSPDFVTSESLIFMCVEWPFSGYQPSILQNLYLFTATFFHILHSYLKVYHSFIHQYYVFFHSNINSLSLRPNLFILGFCAFGELPLM